MEPSEAGGRRGCTVAKRASDSKSLGRLRRLDVRNRIGDGFRIVFSTQLSMFANLVETASRRDGMPVHERDRFAFGKLSPPTSGNRPQTKPTSLTVRSVFLYVLKRICDLLSE